MHPLTFQIYLHMQNESSPITGIALPLINIMISSFASARLVKESLPFFHLWFECNLINHKLRLPQWDPLQLSHLTKIGAASLLLPMPTTAAISCCIEEVRISLASDCYKYFLSGHNFFTNIIFHPPWDLPQLIRLTEVEVSSTLWYQQQQTTVDVKRRWVFYCSSFLLLYLFFCSQFC